MHVVDEPSKRPIIPGRCLDADMNKFLNGPTLADTEVRFGKEGVLGNRLKWTTTVINN